MVTSDRTTSGWRANVKVWSDSRSWRDGKVHRNLRRLRLCLLASRAEQGGAPGACLAREPPAQSVFSVSLAAALLAPPSAGS